MILTSLALAMCGPIVVQEAPAVAPAAQLVGRYEFREDEMAAVIDLRADGSFSYRVDPLQPEVQEDPIEKMRWDGRWHLQDSDEIVLESAPGPPPRLVQTAAVRDGAVRIAVTVTGPEPRVAAEVGLVVDDEDTPTLRDGRWTRPLRASIEEGKAPTATALPRRIGVVYGIGSARPSVTLAALTPVTGGPNRFTFAYTPSPVVPFLLRGLARDVRGGLIEVELGTSGLPMRRTAPARAPE